MADDSWIKWRDSVAYKLIEERNEADARYMREHRRAIFMAATLDKVRDAMPDIIGRPHSQEKLQEALENIWGAMGRWVNAMGGDDAWYEVQYDLDEWEREYFGPRPVPESVESEPLSEGLDKHA